MLILSDFQTSVRKALTEIDPKWESYPGLIICGTHDPKVNEVENLINEIKAVREQNLPFLGICYGHQLAAIEYARNVLGIKDATSEEFGIPGTFVVKKLPKINVGLKDGESNWNHYEVTPEILHEWQKGRKFFSCQFHPEYQSSIDKPHWLLVEFLRICRTAA